MNQTMKNLKLRFQKIFSDIQNLGVKHIFKFLLTTFQKFWN